MSNTDSPLHLAVKNNNIEIAKMLLESQSDVHAVNAEGLTPLQLATQAGNAEMITLLFQHGAGNPPNASPQLLASPGHPVQNPPVDKMSNINQRKERITFWTIFYTIVSVLSLGVGFISYAREFAIYENQTLSPEVMKEAAEAFDFFTAVELLILLPLLYCFFMYLYRLWEEVPVEFARTTPGSAAGFSLIPFFGWIWWFTAFVGLYKDMNKAMESYGLGTRFDTTWIRIVCVYWLAYWIFLIIFNVMGGMFTDPDVMKGVCIINMFLMFLDTFITIPTFWIIRNTALKFVDIKSSNGH